jgi:hypothetical protein
MNPRKVGAPGKEINIVDDFVSEEPVLELSAEPYPNPQADEVIETVIPDDQLTHQLEMFPLESRPTRAARGTTVLDFDEPLNRPSASATGARTARAGPATGIRPRRSILRSVGVIGIITVSTGLAVIGGAALKSRLDLAALRNRLDLSVLSNDLEIVRTKTPALRELLPWAEVVRDSAVAGLPTAPTDSPSAPVAATKSVVADKPEDVKVASPRSQPSTTSQSPTRAARPSARPSASAGRTRAAASPPTPTIQRRESSAPARAAAITSAAPAVPPLSSAPAAPAANSAPAVPAVSSAPAVPVPSPAPAVAAVSSAPPVPPLNSAPLAVGSSAAATPSAPSPTPPPAAVAAPSATPAGGLTAETRAVALALNRYQDAFSALDANAAHAVWPSVDVRALAKAFDQLEEQTFDLEGCDITVTGARAEAVCAGNARYVRKVGNRALRVEPRRWRFTLRQTSDQWVIDTVDAR